MLRKIIQITFILSGSKYSAQYLIIFGDSSEKPHNDNALDGFCMKCI